LPDLKPKSKMPNRKWTTAVICSLKPEFMRQTIDHSLKLRLNEGIVRDREAKVEICAEYLELLENARKSLVSLLCIMLMLTFLIAKKGRTLAHLKMKE